MKLELKSIKIAAFASEETHCYEAVVYLDGKAWARVGNDGHGGPDRVDPVKGPMNSPAFAAELKIVNAELALSDEGQKFLAEFPRDFGAFGAGGLEWWCGNRITEHLLTKDLRKAMKRSGLYAEDGKIYETGFKGVRKLTDEHWTRLKSKYPEREWLNDMPFDKALTIYTGMSA